LFASITEPSKELRSGSFVALRLPGFPLSHLGFAYNPRLSLQTEFDIAFFSGKQDFPEGKADLPWVEVDWGGVREGRNLYLLSMITATRTGPGF
jgi:hypothetical protein